jgi:hypothetical protein
MNERPPSLHPRLATELRTVRAMIRLYCRQRHGSRELCGDCSALSEYAERRLEACPFGGDKPTCLHCTVHCYRPDMKERIREVMRFAGPRMIMHHPILAIRHMIHNRRCAAKEHHTKAC